MNAGKEETLKQKSYSFSHHSIFGIEQLSAEDIRHILATAASFREIAARPVKKVPTLRGKTVINLFFEPSTRTRTSFEIAAKRMSADTFNINASTSSTSKGETLIDTTRNLQAMAPDIIIVRHSAAGVPELLGRHVRASIINAGDGAHEHPSQALLDMMTVMENKGHIDGLKIAIIGDISHSRVAISDFIGFTRMGAKISVAAPQTYLPTGVEQFGVDVCSSVADAVKDADVVITLRIQLERQNDSLIPSLREYSRFYGINSEILKGAKDDVIVMHPGPVNRGVELNPDVADGRRSVILDQVANGVAVRMALLYLVHGGKRKKKVQGEQP
ncbi:aspartate carbamoyltransferase catalytic subunit [Desulforhopalus vacuolatus]|uniref:aspartate carbamoyltransferase catalytic subunit n=1 Tax=Desulforhopalus vacuolatus TaxID=40414 RepID=UPI001966CAD6|nr:aspartate carbamoyltransferase catalytic subunit [Desulforhopalus vacuolatus]MBM9519680.1 aspartate carbamoyltransferase catalytic subunit [Desulforhopalus vacuolatus]